MQSKKRQHTHTHTHVYTPTHALTHTHMHVHQTSTHTHTHKTLREKVSTYKFYNCTQLSLISKKLNKKKTHMYRKNKLGNWSKKQQWQHTHTHTPVLKLKGCKICTWVNTYIGIFHESWIHKHTFEFEFRKRTRSWIKRQKGGERAVNCKWGGGGAPTL